MATFPVLYLHGTTAHQPQLQGYSDTIAFDPTIRSPKDAGYVKTRTRFTRYPRQYTIVFNNLSTTNKNTLLAFEEARGVGGESFTWVDPASNSLTVRYAAPATCTPRPNTNFTRWTVELTLEEV